MKIPFEIGAIKWSGCHSSAIVLKDENPLEALADAVMSDLGLEVAVKIGDITMPLCMWQYPDHWSDEWREHAGDEDADEFVANLLEREMAT